MGTEQLELFPLGVARTADAPAEPILPSSAPLSAAMEPFTGYMRQRELATNTIKSFLNDLKLFAAFIGPQTPLRDLTTRKLEQFLDYLERGRGVPCSPKSLARRITTLKVFFGWLARGSVLPTDIAAPLPQHEAVSPLPQILSDRQVEEVLSVTSSMRDAPESPDARPHLLVTLVLDAALKKSECMRLRLHDIDLSESGKPVVVVQYDKPRQRFKARRLALPAEWAETLQPYLRRYQPRERLFECTPRNLEYVLHTVSVLANLPTMLTFETLRWTSAVRSFRQGMDEEHLRKRLGLSRVSWQIDLPIIRKLGEGPL
jgi:integrase/recombinase XerD